MVNVKKLKGYIRDDRPQRLKRYVLSHDLDVNTVRTGNGGGLLHYCSSVGSAQMLKCLLQLECSPDCQDKDRNLPLHVAALRALQGDGQELEEVYQGLVIPLLNAYPLGQDVENRDYTTGHDLLSQLKTQRKRAAQSSSTSGDMKPLSSMDDQDNEDEWREKLAEEAMFETEGDSGLFSAFDNDDTYRTRESFEEFSERMRREYSSKRQHSHNRSFPRDRKRRSRYGPSWEDNPKSSRQGAGDSSSQHKSQRQKDQEEEENMRRAREEMKKRYKPPKVEPSHDSLVAKKRRYEEKFSQVISHLSGQGQTLTFAKIPWPHSDVDVIVETLFCDIEDREGEQYRKYLRAQRVRWHPDKFSQRFGEYLHPAHREKILTRVKVISQMLNKLSQSQG